MTRAIDAVAGHDAGDRRSDGDLMARLKRLGLDDRTLVVFTSDNGLRLARRRRALPVPVRDADLDDGLA